MAFFPEETLYPDEALYPDGGEPTLGFGVVDIVFPGSAGTLFDARRVAEGTQETTNDDLRHALQIILSGTNTKALNS